MADFLEFYSRKDIQKAIVSSAVSKEVAIKYAKGFGKRPDILNFENDVFELAKQGATSFHISEEHWTNPLLLKPGMSKHELDKLRSGFDVLLDIDTPFVDYSKATALLLIEALKYYNINHIGLKFSGGTGFHLGIPFSSLPEEVNGKDIKLLFPEVPRAMATYLKDMIKPKLSEHILKISTLQEISKATGKPQTELMEGAVFNPFSIIEIDTVLISNRHLYRAPYSLNEKKGLISIPVLLEDLKNFNLKKARIENIKNILPFLPQTKEKEASHLVARALEEINKRPEVILPGEQPPTSKKYEELKTTISSDFFPPCIISLLKGIKEDGRKRALFILINFLRTTGHPMSQVETLIQDWNKRNAQPLGDSYISAQLNWHKRQTQTVLPPNCSNLSYYKDLGVKCPDEICTRCKNPVSFTKRRFFAHKRNKPKTRKKKATRKK